MSERLPLFPLGTVLFPGMVLPLHIFEERYRTLVRDLRDGPEPRRFGVIAIKKGRETGIDGVSALYEVGCTTTLREAREYDDGRYDLVTVGTQRFRLEGLDDSLPYLQADVELLPEETGEAEAANLAAHAVTQVFRRYLDALSSRGLAQVNVPDLPEEPVLLSYLIAAAMIIDLPDRQDLLAEPDALSRLTAERALLSRETTMLRTLTARPAPDLRNAPYSPNLWGAVTPGGRPPLEPPTTPRGGAGRTPATRRACGPDSLGRYEIASATRVQCPPTAPAAHPGTRPGFAAGGLAGYRDRPACRGRYGRWARPMDRPMCGCFWRR
jgi:uncharacterized protein